MKKEKYNKLVNDILEQINGGIKTEDIIGNFIFNGFLYKDIEKVFNELIISGKVSRDVWNGGEEVGWKSNKNSIKSPNDSFLDFDENKENKSYVWWKLHKKSLFMGVIFVFVILIISGVAFYSHENKPENKLYGALSKLADANSFFYSIDINREKIEKDINYDDEKYETTYVKRIEGSINLYPDVSKSLNIYLHDNIKDESLGSKSSINIIMPNNNDWYFLINNPDIKLLNDMNNINYVAGVWIRVDKFSEIDSIFKDFDINRYLEKVDLSRRANEDTISSLTSLLKDKLFEQNINRIEPDNSGYTISFDINPDDAGFLRGIINQLFGLRYGNMDVGILSTSLFTVELDENENVKEINIVTSVDEETTGYQKIVNVKIVISKINNKSDIMAPNSYIDFDKLNSIINK